MKLSNFLLPALLVSGLFGCASEAPAAAEDDINASTHGKTVLACQAAYDKATNADPSTAGLIAAAGAAEICLRNANNKVRPMLDKRRGYVAPSSKDAFNRYRAASVAACNTRIDAGDDGGSMHRAFRASCEWVTERRIARLLQTVGSLGGMENATLRYPSKWSDPRIEGCFIRINQTGEQRRSCVEKGVKAALQKELEEEWEFTEEPKDPAAIATLNAMVDTEDQAFCNVLTAGFDVGRANSCRVNAAMALLMHQ